MGDRTVRCAGVALALAVAGCGQIPLTPGSGHLKPEAPRAEGTIPPPVQVAPMLPVPKPTARPETYSVVVNEVRVHDLLFALARDAKLNVDIHPGVTGTVTLNALDQTLPQLLSRISKQVDMRYEIDGPNLVVMRDTPYLRVYRIDYVNLARDSKSVSNLSTQVSGGTTGPSGGSSGSQNNSTSVINSLSNHKFWETLTANIRDILRETDRLLPAPSAQPAPAPAPAPATTTPPGGPAIIFNPAPPPAAPLPTGPEFREAAAVIVNPEAGVVSIRATARQHEKIQEFLDQVMASAKRQVLIEVTVMEVQLNNQYQRGIDWSRVRNGASGFTLRQSSAATPAAINTTAFIIDAAAASIGFSATIKLLESFGDVRVLSSPKVSVINNQTAVLKVVDNLVYFTIQSNTTSTANVATTTFTTTVNSVPVGFIMSVVPQISENDSILLNLRPTISRKLTDAADPNPALANPCGIPVPIGGCNIPAIANLIPVIQTREMESVLRVQSGQVAVLGGLMQDSVTNIEDTIPGVRTIPGLGQLLAQRKDVNQKTELVIFLQPTVIRDASMEGDLRHLRHLLPGDDYFTRPNPSREPPGR
jgi:MSHA biogenesis protein MshL